MNTRNVVIVTLFMIAVAAVVTVAILLQPQKNLATVPIANSETVANTATTGQFPPATPLSQDIGPGLTASLGPTLVGHLAGLAEGGVGAYAHYVYATINHQAYVIDVSNPALPTPVALFDGGSMFNDIAIVGSYAYVTRGGLLFSGQGLQTKLDMYSLADPRNPKKVGEYTDTSEDAVGYNNIYINNGHAFVTDGFSTVYIFDVSHPQHPTKISTTTLQQKAGGAAGMAGLGNYLYIADGDNGFAVLDVADPNKVKLIQLVDTVGSPKSVAVAGAILYVADIQGYGMMAYDVRAPSAPRLIAQQYAQHDVFGSHDGRNFVVTTATRVIGVSSNGLTSFDINKPGSLTALTNIGLDGESSSPSYGVTILGKYLYVTEYTTGLLVYNISQV